MSKIPGLPASAGRGPVLCAAASPLLAQRDPSRPLNYRCATKADRGELFLYDIIGAGWFGGIGADQVSKDLKAMGAVKTIDVRINSDGGDVFEGRTIFNQLRQHQARIVVHVDGLAASIASLIAMAGDEIRMGEGTFMMIHNAWGVARGQATEMRRVADLLDSVTASIADSYAARTRKDRATIDKWMNEETWFTARDAVDEGFADVVAEPVKAAASVRDPSLFRNLPAALHPSRVRATASASRIRGLLQAA